MVDQNVLERVQHLLEISKSDDEDAADLAERQMAALMAEHNISANEIPRNCGDGNGSFLKRIYMKILGKE